MSPFISFGGLFGDPLSKSARVKDIDIVVQQIVSAGIYDVVSATVSAELVSAELSFGKLNNFDNSFGNWFDNRFELSFR